MDLFKGLLGKMSKVPSRIAGGIGDIREKMDVNRRGREADAAMEGFESQPDSGSDFIGPMSPYTRGKQDLMQRDAFRSLRDVMGNFDSSDKESVMRMQKLLNASGITDAEGNPLDEDGVFGQKTLSALRGAQKFRNEADAKLAVNRADMSAYNPAGTQGVIPDQDVRKGFFPGGRMGVYEKPEPRGGVIKGNVNVNRVYE